MENSNITRYCERCRENKDISNFKKYRIVCKECKEKIINVNKSKFYSNIYKCVCGCYISDANPIKKHEQTQSHKNYLIFGHRGGESSLLHFENKNNFNTCF